MFEVQTDLPRTPTPIVNIHLQLYPSALVAKMNTALSAREYNTYINDGRNVNNQKSNKYQTTCAEFNGKKTRKVHF